jgi:hypothetical protein
MQKDDLLAQNIIGSPRGNQETDLCVGGDRGPL